ncbi:hypothetical protein GGS21DRAFT_487252 [Xylaria nigripes]|nr:hypothetical protein GGS21DRAFT_487252 [Xylaria nigripes]
MAYLNQAFVDGAHVVAKVVEHHVREAAATTLASVISTPAVVSSTADPSITPTGSPNDDKKDGGSNNSSSPLLFFVALGFGVVFTNLWIIVGVKYCFRYNARNRVMARLDENGEPIDLQNMPARPHRRRREKKLMTMDEVNEKFPMVKYKTWVLDRKKEGLPTTGGISAPPSRANSVRSVQGIVPEQPRASSDSPANNNAHEPDPTAQNEIKPDVNDQHKLGTSDEVPDVIDKPDTDKPATNSDDAHGDTATEHPQIKDPHSRPSEEEEEEEDDEDDHVHPALDPDMMGSSGDTCAICIDTLEDNDDVRGLTCGHAFHAVCLDPWLTNRRACCPLCKADYYTPKARPQPAEGEGRDPNAASSVDPARNNGRMNYPRQPVRSFAWTNFRDAPRQWFPGRYDETRGDLAQHGRYPRSRQNPVQSSRRNVANQAQIPSPEGSNGNLMTRLRSQFPSLALDQVMRRNREQNGPMVQESRSDSNTTPPATTPSQLEAGVRSSTSRPN